MASEEGQAMCHIWGLHIHSAVANTGPRARLDSCLRTITKPSGGSSRDGTGLDSHLSQIMGPSLELLPASVRLGTGVWGGAGNFRRQVKTHFKTREPFLESRPLVELSQQRVWRGQKGVS